jgi:hypothetical protein
VAKEDSERTHLKHAIARRLFWRGRVFDPERAGNASPRLSELRAWQAKRLEASFADVLADPKMHSAGRFFLSDLYGDQDFTGRDRDVDRIMPIMVHLMPESLLRAARDAIELHALSHALDLRMVHALGSAKRGRIDTAAYAKAYREVGLMRLRSRQIGLIMAVGRSLDAAVQRHGVHRLLKASRLPARMAGLSELQAFLERGFEAFAQLDGADRFLQRVERGEHEVSRRLYTGHPDPFGP